MVAFYDSISDDHAEWALKQQVFFIASAPLVGDHVNLSPKGMPMSTLHVFDGNNVAYMDATGSGIETVSHIYENGRATIMFCSFGKSPRIMRWFCTGRVVEWDQPEFEELLKKMNKAKIDGARAIIMLHVWKGKPAAQLTMLYVSNFCAQHKHPAASASLSSNMMSIRRRLRKAQERIWKIERL